MGSLSHEPNQKLDSCFISRTQATFLVNADRICTQLLLHVRRTCTSNNLGYSCSLSCSASDKTPLTSTPHREPVLKRLPCMQEKPSLNQIGVLSPMLLRNGEVWNNCIYYVHYISGINICMRSSTQNSEELRVVLTNMKVGVLSSLGVFEFFRNILKYYILRMCECVDYILFKLLW